MSNVDIRGKQDYTGGGDVMVSIGATSNADLRVAQGAEMNRLGDGWTVGTSTLFAPLVAYPTTTAALEVYNNSTSLGRCMVISELYAAQILSTAATQTYAIFAMITTQKAIPTLTALTLFSTSGKATVTPTAAGEIVTGVGTTVVANGWRVPVNGKLVVPPGASICLHVVGSLATASTFQAGLSFNWVTMTQEV
jgi:hypothetical protein